jgi:hypothetical protein
MRRGRGLYPIASRRHQGPGDSYHTVHDPTGDAEAIVGIWVLAPILALGGPISGKYDYLTTLAFMILVAIICTYLVLTSD